MSDGEMGARAIPRPDRVGESLPELRAYVAVLERTADDLIVRLAAVDPQWRATYDLPNAVRTLEYAAQSITARYEDARWRQACISYEWVRRVEPFDVYDADTAWGIWLGVLRLRWLMSNGRTGTNPMTYTGQEVVPVTTNARRADFPNRSRLG